MLSNRNNKMITNNQLICSLKTKQISAPIRTLIYQSNKWVPNIIPIDEIDNLAEAFERLPKKHKLESTDKTPEFIIQRNQALFWFSYYLALRPLEAVSIKFSDIWNNHEGKYFIRIRGEENKLKKDRILPLPKKLVGVLIELFNEFSYRNFWKNSPYLFPSTMNKQNHLSRDQWNDIFQKAIKEACLWREHPNPKKKRGFYTAYSLRHSRAVDLLEKSNFDLWSVANVLGHCRINVVACYLPLCSTIQEHIRKVME